MSTNYLDLNAELNLFDEAGNIQFDKDKEAAKQYFLQHVNQNTVFFHTLEEKVEYMKEGCYWDIDVLAKYKWGQVKSLFKQAYNYKFRFPTFVGALKFYQQYATKTPDTGKYLERYEDRVVLTALELANGSYELAQRIVNLMMQGIYQPATPTFLNSGKYNTGELVSCFLLRTEDNMESIGKTITNALQLSKRGGGVSILLTNIREEGAPIKNIENVASGVVPIMKILEDSFSYANQLGARQGAGAVYLSCHHPDIMGFLDTKRENADEKIRIKTLSLGVVVTDIMMQLAKENKPMYLFSPYDIQTIYQKPMSDISITELYDELVDNPNIRKTPINPRELLRTIAQLQFESGYPYIMYEDTVNKVNPINGRINMSNLCSEILQINTESMLSEDQKYLYLGKDISCNLGSLNIKNVMDHQQDFRNIVKTSIEALNYVTTRSIKAVPTIAHGNNTMRSIGLGQMNLHGYLASVGIKYGSPEALTFVNNYFETVRYYALLASNELAETGAYPVFEGFNKSDYADGTALAQYTERIEEPEVSPLFNQIKPPTKQDWIELDAKIRKHGLANSYLLAVPPTGSISYVNNATASIHPITSPVEIRKEGKLGRVYYPAPGLTNDNLDLYESAYQMDQKLIIDTYAEATKHTDQGLSLTLFFPSTATTRDINKAQLYAWSKGIKTLYYVRVQQQALEGTEVDCVSCTI